MFPPVLQTIITPAVQAIVGERIAPFGEIDQDASRPYVTWFIVAGQPFDALAAPPCGDMTTVQLDCWSPDARQCRALAEAIRAALDAANVCNRLVLNRRETSGSRLYRIGMEADFITGR